MGNNDTKKIGKTKLQAVEWATDMKPKKTNRAHKRTERQSGKKEARKYKLT